MKKSSLAIIPKTRLFIRSILKKIGECYFHIVVIWCFCFIAFTSCVPSHIKVDDCDFTGVPISFQSLKDSTTQGLYLFKTPVFVEGYVVSSDTAGQFYGKLVLQESLLGTSLGIVLETDLSDTALWYPIGQKVQLKLKGLYADTKTLGLSLGNVFTSFGNLSIGRLPVLSTRNHVNVACQEVGIVIPVKKKISQLTNLDLQTLIQIDSLQINSAHLGLSFADYQEESLRSFNDVQGNTIVLTSSGYSDFWDTQIPNGWLNISGVLTKKRSQYQLEIRSLKDIEILN